MRKKEKRDLTGETRTFFSSFSWSDSIPGKFMKMLRKLIPKLQRLM